MIKTPLSTVIGGAFWTPEATVINGAKLSFEIVMKKLFANGEQGFAYDPNDLTTMFQDAAGTVPVTAVGQPVGLILDKSGRNNHARQTTSASRPILRQNAVTGANYLEFDGVDDWLESSVSVPPPSTALIALKNTKDTLGSLLSSGSAGYIRSFRDLCSIQAVDTTIPPIRRNAADVIVHKSTGSGAEDTVTLSSSQDTQTYGSKLSSAEKRPWASRQQKYIGTFSFDHTALISSMHLYGIILIGKRISSSEETELRKYFNKRMGI